ncbi:hypothetical protein [Pendulispora albinea]|uniref:Uncharacterized protein n=1 Tax=Pendulispora albinea TaxID=2741071 RepID=A0ABZ2M761_9BACT
MTTKRAPAKDRSLHGPRLSQHFYRRAASVPRDTPQKFQTVRDKLRGRGDSQPPLDKIMGGNVTRLFFEVCG